MTRARGVIYVSISQSDTINEVKDFSRFTFHEALNPHMTTAAVATHTFKKGSKVAYLVADYAYGHEMLRGFKHAQAAIGAESVGEILHPLGVADYSTFTPRLRSMRPDILCICNFGRDQANAIKQAVDFGMKQQMKIVVPVLLYNQRLLSVLMPSKAGGSNYYWELEESIPSAGAQQCLPRGEWWRSPDRLWRLRLHRRLFVAACRASGRRHRYRQGDRGAGRVEIRRRKRSAALSQMRPSIGAIGPCARIQEEGGHEERGGSVQHLGD